MLLEMAAPAIRTSALTKDYGAGRGVFGLELQVDQHRAIGLLGAEDAGKTTTLQLLMGLIRPTRGSAYVFGLDCVREAVEVKRRVGYVPAETPDFAFTPGGEIVAYVAGLRGGVNAGDVHDLAERLDLDLGLPHRDYADGERQKLSILLAFMHHPDLLILDDPSRHLDADAGRELRSLIAESRDDGAAVFLATDVVTLAEELCDSVAILRRGRLVRDLDEPRPRALPPP